MVNKRLDHTIFAISLLIVTFGVLALATYFGGNISVGQAFSFSLGEERTISNFLTGLESDPVGYMTVSSSLPGTTPEQVPAGQFAGWYSLTEARLDNENITYDYFVAFSTLNPTSNALVDNPLYHGFLLDVKNWNKQNGTAIVKLFENSANELQLFVIGTDLAALNRAVDVLTGDTSSLNSDCIIVLENSQVRNCGSPVISVVRDGLSEVYQGQLIPVSLKITVDSNYHPLGEVIIGETVINGKINTSNYTLNPNTDYVNESVVAWAGLSPVNESLGYEVNALDNPVTFSGKYGLQFELAEGVITGLSTVSVIVDSDGDGVFDDVDCQPNNASIYPGKPEVCNGYDDNCDNVTDGITQACSDAPLSNQGIGLCSMGTQTCTSGNWSGCVGDVLPSTEVCDKGLLDENCDGTANENCSCIVGDIQYCGDQGVNSVCIDLNLSCSNGNWQPMVCNYSNIKGYQDVESLCDGLDNDCDGAVDEGCDTIGTLKSVIKSQPKLNKTYKVVVGANSDPSDSIAGVAVAGSLGIIETVFSSEVANITSGDYVLIGGACANPAVAELEGKGALGCDINCSFECRQGYGNALGGFAKIEVLPEVQGLTRQIIVAGGTADDTRRAGNALVQINTLDAVYLEIGGDMFSPVVN